MNAALTPNRSVYQRIKPHIFFRLLFSLFIAALFYTLQVSTTIASKPEGKSYVHRSVLAQDEIVDTPAQSVHTHTLQCLVMQCQKTWQ